MFELLQLKPTISLPCSTVMLKIMFIIMLKMLISGFQSVLVTIL